MRKYIIMASRAAESTHAKLLAEHLDLEHISVGDIFPLERPAPQSWAPRSGAAWPAGELVDDDLVGSVVHRRLSEHDWNYGFIIDGFPATSPRPASSWRATTSAR